MEAQTRIEVYLNGRKVLEVTDSEEPEPDLICVIRESVVTAITAAPACTRHDHE